MSNVTVVQLLTKVAEDLGDYGPENINALIEHVLKVFVHNPEFESDECIIAIAKLLEMLIREKMYWGPDEKADIKLQEQLNHWLLREYTNYLLIAEKIKQERKKERETADSHK